MQVFRKQDILNRILNDILEIEKISQEEKPLLQILGFGEISTVFGLEGYEWVYKKLPSFQSLSEVEKYRATFYEYLKLLQNAGINLPEQNLHILERNSKYVVYVRQKMIKKDRIGNKLIHTLKENEINLLLKKIFLSLLGVYRFNMESKDIKIGIDGQISNWADTDGKIFYLDTTSPLIRVKSVEQLNTEVFLKSAPYLLRSVIKKYFLKEVLDRYYDLRRILVDLVANFFKERRGDIISSSVLFINGMCEKENIKDFKPITLDEVKKYYRMDAFIWRFYQASRKIDRFITTLFGKEYELILPEKIKR